MRMHMHMHMDMHMLKYLPVAVYVPYPLLVLPTTPVLTLPGLMECLPDASVPAKLKP